MNAYEMKRRSHCMVCGKRLSEKNLFGDIQWWPSQVADEGLFCVICYKEVIKYKARKDAAHKDQKTASQ